MLALPLSFPLPRLMPVVILGESIFCPTPLRSTRLLLSARVRVQVGLWLRLQNRHYLCRPFISPLQVNVSLIPPPSRHPRYRPPSGPFTEVHNWSRRNILRDRVLSPCDGFPDPLEACFPHCLLQWRVCSTLAPPYPQLRSGEPSRDPVLEAIQVPIHPRGEHPRLRPEQQHRLRHRFVEISRHFRICPLSSQYPRYPPPTLSCLTKVAYQHKQFIFSCCQHPSQVSKRRYIL